MQNRIKMKKNNLIALTGGIGSGKSQALSILKNLGEKTLNCDGETDKLYKNRKVIKQLAKIFPHAVRGKVFKRIDKPTVAKTVFSDKQKLKELTALLTPLILQRTLAKAKRLGGRVFIEVPLLFECNAQDEFYRVVVIKRDLNNRISSVISRSNITKEQVLERINAQVDYDGMDLSPYTVIQNDGTPEQLQKALIDFLQTL